MGFNLKKWGKKVAKKGKALLRKAGDDIAEQGVRALGLALAPVTGGASVLIGNLAANKAGEAVARLTRAAKLPGKPALVDAGTIEGADQTAAIPKIGGKTAYRFYTFS